MPGPDSGSAVPARGIFPAPVALADQGITLRPRGEGDRPFLLRLYIDFRWSELAATPWDPEGKVAFLESQFEFQDRHYRTHYVETEYYVIERAGVPIGRLYLDRAAPTEVRVVDIAFLQTETDRGYGSTLLRAIMADAASRGQVVTLHVEVFNRARVLYERLGYQFVEERGPYLFLRWTPPGSGP